MTRRPTDSPSTAGPWVIDTRELGRSPGLSRGYRRSAPAPDGIGLADVVRIPGGASIELDVLLESVMEGVLVSGTAIAPTTGECARCLDPIADQVEVGFTELFAYPDSATEATTDADEVRRLVGERIDLEPVVRDAIVLALPAAPLCAPDCAGLCAECGEKWADLTPGHRHEKIDPRWAALRERLAGGEERPGS